MRRVRASYAVIVSLLAALAVVGPPMTAGARAPWSCRLAGTGMQDFLWSSDQGGRWGDGSNWRGQAAPVSASDSYACIKQPVTVTIGPDSGRIDLGAFELGNQTTLLIEPGTELYVAGGPEQPSIARAGSLVVVRGGTLGGTGLIILRGTLRLLPAGDVPARLATGTTSGVTISSFPQLLVDDQGRLEVMGDGPSSIADVYHVEVRGWVGIGGPGSDQASLAADHGTSFELVPQDRRPGVGTLELLNDQGYAEGDGVPGTPLSTFTNRGLVTKTAGGGVSRIAAAYSSADGHVSVEQGSLLLPDETFARASVQPGATYGTGTCDADTAECGNGTTEDRQQAATLTVPGRAVAEAGVVVTQVDDKGARALGTPVKAHATALASRAAPYVIELRYDASLLEGRTWQDLQVKHKASGHPYYSVVPTCLKAGAIPATSDACVDRSGDPDTSSRTLTGDSAGDVVMVVRTTRTSRWIAY